MAKWARCENPGCHVEAPLRGSLEQVPHGWVDATLHVEGSQPNVDFLACSPSCMEAIMRERALFDREVKEPRRA